MFKSVELGSNPQYCHGSYMGKFGPVALDQPNLLHTIAVKIKWKRRESSRSPWIPIGEKSRVKVQMVMMMMAHIHTE